MIKLYCKKTGETQIIESAEKNTIEFAVKLWVMLHNERHPSNRITKRDIIIVD